MLIKSLAAVCVLAAAAMFAGCQSTHNCCSTTGTCCKKADAASPKPCCAEAKKAGTACKTCSK